LSINFFFTLDTEKGQFQLAFLEPKFPAPKSVEDYKTSIFAFNTPQIHAIDKTDLHKKVAEIIYSTLAISATETSKLQASLNNINT